MVWLLWGLYISESELNLFLVKISLGEHKRRLPLGFHGPWLFMPSLVVSGGRDEGRENGSGINRCLWVKSRKSCLIKGKPYVCLSHCLSCGAGVFISWVITCCFKNEHRTQAHSPHC